MEQRPPKPMTPFDELTMPPQFRMIKLMLPFIPDNIRPMLAVFLKFMELQYTIQLVSQNPNCFSPGGFTSRAPSSQGFSLEQMEEILPYLSQQESEMVESMRSMMNMMNMMQAMQEMQATQNTDDSGSSDQDDWNGNSGFDPMTFLQTMLSPDQQERFRTYQNIFETEGEDSHE